MSDSSIPPTAENGVELIVYIGNLPIKLSNEVAVDILQKCGPLIHLRRQSDPTNDTSASFGFCQFADCQGVYNAVNILAGMELQNKAIKVICDDKTKYQLTGWLARREAHLLDHPEDEKSIKEEEEEVRKKIQRLLADQDARLDEECRRLKALYEDRKKRDESGLSDSQTTSVESEGKRRRTGDDKVECSYISKDYKVHWKETERMNRLKHKLKEIYLVFLRHEREWLKDEERLFKYIARKRESIGKISERDRERAMREDETTDCVLTRDILKRGRDSHSPPVRALSPDPIRAPKAEDGSEQSEPTEVHPEEQQSTATDKGDAPKSDLPQNTDREGSQDVEVGCKSTSKDEAVGAREPLPRGGRVFPSKIVFSKPLKVMPRVVERPVVGTVFISESESDVGTEEVRSDAKSIMSRVPKDVDAVFAYELDWKLLLSDDILNGKVRPWVRKKVVECMGAEDSLVPQVVDYILSRVSEVKNPKCLLSDVERFLDNEAAPLVTGLWRLLIYQQLSRS